MRALIRLLSSLAGAGNFIRALKSRSPLSGFTQTPSKPLNYVMKDAANAGTFKEIWFLC
jgi:hypothetical protein